MCISENGDIYISTGGNDCIYINEDSAKMFFDLKNVGLIQRLELINTKNVKTMLACLKTLDTKKLIVSI